METETLFAQWCKIMGYTDRHVGDKMGVDPALVWRVRKGERQPTDGFAWRFGRAFGFELAQRFFEPEREKA
jgi:transcriptional regulator with XRE-family HTH domain